MSRKAVSIIIICLIMLGSLPLYSAYAGTGEDSASTGAEKSAKAPKSPGGEVSNVRIVYDAKYNTTNYTCWKTGYGSSWNGTTYNDLNTVKNAGVIRRNTTFNITATGISSENIVRVKGPCDVGESRPNITTWNPKYDSNGLYWNFTAPANAPVGDYQIYLNESFCTVYVIFDVFLTKSAMNDTEFSSWAYNESNDASLYGRTFYPTANAMAYYWPFTERTTELAVSIMGGSTTTEYYAAINLYRLTNARIVWDGVYAGLNNVTNISNTGMGLNILDAKKVALQTGHTLPAGMVIDGQCTVFSTFLVGLSRSIGIPARDINAYDTAGVGPWGWNYHNWAECYIEDPDMSLSSTNKKWLLFDATDTMTSTSQNSNGEASIDTSHDYYFHSLKLDLAVTSAGNAAVLGTVAYLWNGGTPSIYSSWDTVDVAPNYTSSESNLPNIDLTSVDYSYFKGDLGAGDRDFFNVTVTGLSSVDIGFIEGAEYAQIYVNNTTTTGSTDFAPNSALKTSYYASLVWGDDKCTVNIPVGVNYIYIMVDNAKEFQYANDYAKDPEDTTAADADAVHGMAETHHYILGIGKVPPKVEVKSPNGNEFLTPDKPFNITWNATDVQTLPSTPINISYSTDGGSAWISIATLQPNNGYYIWSIPEVESSACRINISCYDTDSKTGWDISDKNFTIRKETPFSTLVSGEGSVANDRFGWNISYAGDLNNDGYDDIAVGAPYASAGGTERGSVYIFFGYSGISTSDINAANANVTISGTTDNGHFGWSIGHGKFDETSGGYYDIVIGEPDNDTGVAYIFFGRASWLSSYTTANANVTLFGELTGDKFGSSVSVVGDVNNDGYEDVIIGAYGYGTDKGRAYIYYGGVVGPPTDSTVYVYSNVTNFGTIENFANAQSAADSGAYANLTETASTSNIYNYVGVTAAVGHNAYECDVDVFPFAGDAANRNTIVEATDAHYTAISASDDTRWLTVDPGALDEIFLWLEMNLTENPAVIGRIDFTFEGYLAVASDIKIYVMKAGADWTLDASWVQVGVTVNIPAAVDSTVTQSLTSGFGDYISATGLIVWGVYETASAEALNIDYVCAKVITYCKFDIEFNTTNVVTAANYFLQLNYNVTSGENFDVLVYNGATWDDMGDLTSVTMTKLQITLNSNQRLGTGWVRVRFVGKNETVLDTTLQDKLYIEYHRIRSYGTLGAPLSAVNVTLTGENDNDKFGFAVSGAGNVNGDYYDDVLVGAPGYDNSRGKAYVVYGGGSLAGNYNVETTILSEDFENGGVWPTDWSVTSADPVDWFLTTDGARYGSITGAGDYAAVADSDLDGGTQDTMLKSPVIDCSVYADVTLSFQHRYDWYSEASPEGIYVYVATDGSVDTADTIAYEYRGADIALETKTIDISAVAGGQSNVQIGWRYYANFDYWWIIDDVYVNGTAEPDVTLVGESANNNFGYSVSALGDINNDSYDDFAVGAPGYDNSTGRVYVYYGSPSLASTDIVTLTQQPGDNGDHWVGKDNWLFSGDVYYTAPINSNLGVGYRDAAGYYKMRSPIQFDLSAIPSDAVVVGGSLKMCTKGSGGGLPFNVEAHRITNSWKEGSGEGQNTAARDGVTWNNRTFTILWDTAGGDFEDANVSITISDSADAWYTWDITSLCQGWVNGSYPNYGMMIKAESSIEATTLATKDVYFYASDNATKHELAPKLELTIRKNADLTISGDKAGDKFGYSVSGKDLNNDSFSDIIVGAPYKDNGTNTDAGAVYVFFGNTTMPSTTNASHADNETFGNEPNMTVGFSVSFADLNNDGYNDIIAGAYNYSSDQGKVYALTCRKATLTVSNWTKNETASVNVGTNDVLMLNMTLTASECTIKVTNIRVNLTNLTGTGVDADVSACRLFHDANDNGIYDAGTDVFLGNQTFSGGSLNFTNLSFDVKYGTPEKLLLLFNITNSADAVGHYVGANLTDYSFISVVRPDNVSNSNFPIQSTNMKITSGVAADTLTVTGLSKAPGFVNQGAVNRTMLNLTFNASANDITITSINISLTGTGIGAGNNANVSNVTIYNDTDKDGNLSSGDEQLNKTQIFLNGYVLFGNLSFVVYYSAGNYTIFVVYEINNTATINATVGANLTNETKITVNTTNGDTVADFSTIWSNNSTIIEPAVINYTFRNETGVLQTGDWKVWGNWTTIPNGTEVNGTTWLRIRNTNCSNASQKFVVDFSQGNFTNTTKDWNISIENNMVFWYFYTNNSDVNNKTFEGTRYNTTVLASGNHTFTFEYVGQYIWILYRIEKITDICPDGNYTASFTVTAV